VADEGADGRAGPAGEAMRERAGLLPVPRPDGSGAAPAECAVDKGAWRSDFLTDIANPARVCWGSSGQCAVHGIFEKGRADEDGGSPCDRRPAFCRMQTSCS